MIKAAHYTETVEALKSDPVIIAMASELPADWKLLCTKGNPDGSLEPTYSFMTGTLNEYVKRSGKGVRETHIGGPAEAIIAVRLEGVRREDVEKAIDRRDERRAIYRSEVERIDAIDRLADKLLHSSEYADTPATEVWDIARDRIDAR